MSETIYCPGCGRHCDLSSPRCGRGRAYAAQLAFQEYAPYQEPERSYDELSQNEKLLTNLQDLGHTIHHQFEGKLEAEMFSCLSQEEKDTLQSLTERLKEDWTARYQESPKPAEAAQPAQPYSAPYSYYYGGYWGGYPY